MRGHGVVVVGPSLPALVQRASTLDTNAQILSRLLSMGDKPIYLEPPAATGQPNAGRGNAPAAGGGAGAGGDNVREWEAGSVGCCCC